MSRIFFLYKTNEVTWMSCTTPLNDKSRGFCFMFCLTSHFMVEMNLHRKKPTWAHTNISHTDMDELLNRPTRHSFYMILVSIFKISVKCVCVLICNQGPTFSSFVHLFSAWKPSVLQSWWWVKDHDQWLWSVKDGGNRWRDGHCLWDSRIRRWGCSLNPCVGGNLVWDN